MEKEKKRRFSAPALLVAYSAAAFSYHAAKWFLFPPEVEPLSVFFLKWRMLHAVAASATSFPAAALAAIAASFGFGDWAAKGDPRFSPRFMDFMRVPLVTTIASAVVYGALFLFAQPMALDSISDMRSRGILFRTAADKAAAAVARSDWKEASGYLGMCQQVWPNSPETEKARDSLKVGLSRVASDDGKLRKTTKGTGTPALAAAATVSEALELARKAFGEKRYFDAHWVAALAERLSKPGAAEAREAARLAADAWNAVSELEPNAADKAAFAVYKKKRDGYAAALAEDWIRAYFIYEELSRTEKDDPDVAKFLKLSEDGAKKVSFFADEVGASVGAVDLDVTLSLPRADSGRDVLRVGRLHPFSDAAYGENVELLSFDAAGRLRYGAAAAYLKALPFRVEGGAAAAKNGTVLLLLALDRDDEAIRWAPAWQRGKAPGSGANRFVLDAPYEDLLLAVRARRGAAALSVPELDRGARALPAYGFVGEAFRAETLRRFAEPFSFLSLAVFVLALSWRQRAPKHVGWASLPILALLPFALDAVVRGYRMLATESAAVFTLTLPYGAALGAVVALQAALLLVALVFLAGQRS